MSKELEKNYNPSEIEERLYQKWLDKKYFHAEVNRDKKPFTIVMPPPNITGKLHMGHALDNTMQDILIRFKRMQGYEALWVPGTDHASISTEVKVTNALKDEGIDKHELGREGFLKRTWEWKKEYGGTITSQLRKIGSSCDWDRERFTMDEGCSKAVQEVFIKLYEKGLIYKGSRIVNWCPVCNTSISDAEVEHEEQAGHFWHINYPVVGEKGRFVEIATTRPETLLGDSALAVNPNDDRYKDLVGKMVELPLTDRQIPIIADEYVDMEFGTGVVKITPAHDPNDFEVGKRHNLPEINILNDDATINNLGGKYAGMDRYEARKAMVADLEAQGLLVRVEDHVHNVGTHDRGKTTVEPMIKQQWFVKMDELIKPAVEGVKNGDIELMPASMDKTYFNWTDNIRDWCISRQLWWGHRIPAWYCDDCGATTVSKEDPCKCSHCGSENIHQDSDTLDTWFSSALWPFSTLGWPDKTEDLEHYYPTNTLVTGYDIIGFWVSRMIFSGLAYTDKAPFDTVLIHGLVRDAQGRKMSKSLGNGIDPLEVIDEYGADALRFTLATGNSPGNDMRFSDEKVKASRNFANKLWNAARFVLMYLTDDFKYNGLPSDLAVEDEWIVSKVNTLAKDVTDNLEKYELGIAIQKLYDFIWDVFCDWYIEIAKIRLQGDDEKAKDTAKSVLVYVLTDILKLLHPFMPFITEEIYQAIPHDCESIMISKWVEYDENLCFAENEAKMEILMSAIRAIRNRRAEMNIPPSKKAKVYVETEQTQLFSAGVDFIKRLASSNDVEVKSSFDNLGNTVTIVTDNAKIYIPMGDLVDFEAERKRLEKELAQAQDKLDFINKKLSNPGFVNKAPEKVVNQNKEDAAKLEDKIANIKNSIDSLGK